MRKTWSEIYNSAVSRGCDHGYAAHLANKYADKEQLVIRPMAGRTLATLTEIEVIKILAKRLDHYLIEPPEEDGIRAFSLREGRSDTRHVWHKTEEEAWRDSIDINSRDELAPVLKELTDEESKKLILSLCQKRGPAHELSNGDILNLLWGMLTIPPRDLAFAIAEAISSPLNCGSAAGGESQKEV